jgi:hypothetical protein
MATSNAVQPLVKMDLIQDQEFQSASNIPYTKCTVSRSFHRTCRFQTKYFAKKFYNCFENKAHLFLLCKLNESRLKEINTSGMEPLKVYL